MCGYCMETAIFSERLAALDPEADYQFAPDMLSLRLQEALDWRAELMASPQGMCKPAAAVALCRWWMDRIHGIAGDAAFESGLGTGLAERLRADAQTVVHAEGWTWLSDWNAPLPDPLPLEAARTALDAYITDRLGMDRKLAERERLPNAWTHLICALAILHQAAPDDPRLQLLALTAPVGSVGLLGVELWLQRRAMRACVAYRGVSFLVDNANGMRSEIIASIATQCVLSLQDLRALHDALVARDGVEMNLSREDLKSIVQRELRLLSG